LKEMSNLAVGPAMAWTTTAIGAIQKKGNVKNPKTYQTVQGHWFVYGPGRTAGGLLQNYSRNCTHFFFRKGTCPILTSSDIPDASLFQSRPYQFNVKLHSLAVVANMIFARSQYLSWLRLGLRCFFSRRPCN
jgi:hypothetical protein